MIEREKNGRKRLQNFVRKDLKVVKMMKEKKGNMEIERRLTDKSRKGERGTGIEIDIIKGQRKSKSEREREKEKRKKTTKKQMKLPEELKPRIIDMWCYISPRGW